MNSSASTPSSVTATTTLLRAELPRLEEHQAALEKELAAVTERLESVRAALGALQALSLAPLVTVSAAPDERGPEAKPGPSAGTEGELATGPKAESLRGRASRGVPGGVSRGKRQPGPSPKVTKPKAAKAGAAETGADTKAAAPVSAPDGGLTEQIIAVLSASGKTPVRAREVAQALGRDATANSINAVRSTLDRLVGTSRAQRAGRGLYRAPAN